MSGVGRVLAILGLLVGPWSGTALAQDTGTITGLVTADGTNAPLAGARVFVAGSTREISTGSDGRFTLTGVTPGAQTVVILRDGYATLSEPVDVASGGTLTLDIRMPEAPTLTQEIVVTGRLSDYAP